uniref:Uncharacterized protein n=1 Tax=Magallana gigas TaxID=29159 RepID=K1QZ36_MAGGI
MSKKIIGKNLSEVSLNENLPEKLKSMGVEDAFRARSARKRHSIQLDKRISIQLQERRSSNASSTSETADSVCGMVQCCFPGTPSIQALFNAVVLIQQHYFFHPLS